MNVLVVDASMYGSTRSIAERIAEALRAHGHTVDHRPAEDAPPPVLYDAAIIGSAIHDRAWLPPATAFLGRNRRALAAMPVWLFSVGMPAAVGAPLRTLASREVPKDVAGFIERAQPQAHQLFSGVIRREHLPPAGRIAFRAFGGRYGDYRNWREIDAWAATIARALAASTGAGTAGARRLEGSAPPAHR